MEKQIITLKNPYNAKCGVKLSRSEKRKAEKELLHFQQHVEPYIEEFEGIVFDENHRLSYKQVYNRFLEGLVKVCDNLNKFKYKIIQVDTYFFQETYKPLEYGRN